VDWFKTGDFIMLIQSRDSWSKVDLGRGNAGRGKSAGLSWFLPLALGMFLTFAIGAEAQVYTETVGVPVIGEEYITAAPTVVSAVPVYVRSHKIVIKQPRRVVLRPAVAVVPPVVTETRVIRPAPVIEQRIIQPAPIVQQRVFWPSPVVQTRAYIPYGW